MTTPNLQLPEVPRAMFEASDEINLGFRRLDAIVHLAVTDKDLTTPPPTAVQGDRYLVPADAIGAWAGWERSIALRLASSWQRIVPRPGWRVRVLDESAWYVYSGTAWEEEVSSGGGGSGNTGMIYSSGTVSTIANTSAETAFTQSLNISTTILLQNVVVRFTAHGVYSTDGAAAPTLRLQAKLGGTTVLDTTAVTTTVAMSNRGWKLEGAFIVVADGASGEIEAQGTARLSTSASSALLIDAENTARISVDLSANRLFEITAQWSAADADNTISLRQLLVWAESGSAVAVSNTVSLVHFDGIDGSTTITDEIATKSWAVTNSAQLDDAEKKFGTASLQIPDNVSRVTSNDHADFGFGTEDFTFEFFLTPISLSGSNEIITDNRTFTDPDGAFFMLYTTGAGTFRLFVDGADRIVSGNNALQVGVWKHYAYSRSSGSGRLFVDGVLIGTWADTTNYAQRAVRIGSERFPSNCLPMYMDELRITKGVGLYTANFTPPSVPFTS